MQSLLIPKRYQTVDFALVEDWNTTTKPVVWLSKYGFPQIIFKNFTANNSKSKLNFCCYQIKISSNLITKLNLASSIYQIQTLRPWGELQKIRDLRYWTCKKTRPQIEKLDSRTNRTPDIESLTEADPKYKKMNLRKKNPRY